MSMGTAANGSTAHETWGEAWGEDEWTGEWSGEWTGEAWGEDEWSGELTGEAWGEDEWTGESYGELEWSPELEWSGEAWGEDEWTGESYGELEWSPELEWSGEAWGEDEWSGEADPFLPLLAAAAPLAAKALPFLAKAAAPAVKALLPVAKQAAGGVVRSILAGARPPAPAMPWRPPMPTMRPYRPMPRPPRFGPFAPMPQIPGMPPVPPGWGGGTLSIGASFSPEVAALLRQLAGALASGESAATAFEASAFGAGEVHGEIAANEQAHEAALTEVLAAEAAHASDDREAGALVGATLPVTIRIVAGRSLRPVVPSLARANSRLTIALRRSGPQGAQLVRLVPTIQRRSIATLRDVARTGRPVTPKIVAPVVAAQAARVLTTPRIAGPALARNTGIRRASVAPAAARAGVRRTY